MQCHKLPTCLLKDSNGANQACEWQQWRGSFYRQVAICPQNPHVSQHSSGGIHIHRSRRVRLQTQRRGEPQVLLSLNRFSISLLIINRYNFHASGETLGRKRNVLSLGLKFLVNGIDTTVEGLGCAPTQGQKSKTSHEQIQKWQTGNGFPSGAAKLI